ncbi:Ankyrin repeat protein 2 [Giardia muris]|uniref:Ankyrin repeat protein 2 n=1 Tax=Giardia muris TaxID=5742 RepID=A0A4Z1T0Y4_GIAMU|nr:Ankyrin repeat protein 2 [Giardia muris]|eukprot:TNJ30635.1 Ankyrin repeat protein 2 [Giardia muris]
MYAAFNGKTDCVRLLLSEAGKQTTKGWKDFPPGMSALMIAAHRNRPEIVQLLLLYEEGLEDSEGHTAHWHAYNGSWGRDYSQVRQLLEKEGSERIPPPKEPLLLLMSAVAGDVGGVRNTTPGHRGSWDAALMMAASHGRPPSVPLLLPLEGTVQQPEGDGPSACTPGGPGRVQDSWRTRRQSTKGTEECTSRGSESLFGSGLTHSSRTYRAVADALEEAVMRKVRERLEMLSPHHILALLSPIEQSEARELGEMVWSALFCEPGALDDAFCEDEMIDRCVVCLSRQKDAVILPCRHLVVCADRIEHCCPYCRGKADEALVVEYPEWPDV